MRANVGRYERSSKYAGHTHTPLVCGAVDVCGNKGDGKGRGGNKGEGDRESYSFIVLGVANVTVMVEFYLLNGGKGPAAERWQA